METLGKDDVDAIAKKIVDHLIAAMADEKVADRISAVWGKYIDRMLGRGLRRTAGVVAVFVLGIATIKFDAIAQIFFKGH